MYIIYILTLLKMSFVH